MIETQKKTEKGRKIVQNVQEPTPGKGKKQKPRETVKGSIFSQNRKK